MSADQIGDPPGPAQAEPVAGPDLTLVLRLRRDRAGRPVGQIGRAGADAAVDVSGWLELMAAVDALLARAAAETPGEVASSG